MVDDFDICLDDGLPELSSETRPGVRSANSRVSESYLLGLLMEGTYCSSKIPGGEDHFTGTGMSSSHPSSFCRFQGNHSQTARVDEAGGTGRHDTYHRK